MQTTYESINPENNVFIVRNPSFDNPPVKTQFKIACNFVVQSETPVNFEKKEKNMTELEIFLYLSHNIPSAPKAILPPKLRRSHRKTLVLDLDETLVHSSFQPYSRNNLFLKADGKNLKQDLYVNFRPFLYEFLEKISYMFEIVLFTASNKVYADQVLDSIDPNRIYFKFRLYRDHCSYENNVFIKDLRILRRDLKDVVIIDNSIMAFVYQLDNGIPITTWIDDPHDAGLLEAFQLLEEIYRLDDPRPFLKSKFNLSRFN